MDPKDNPNYIGATNWAKVQTQYTPYQLEKATTRDDKGNIFWNPDVNISNIPSAEPITKQTVSSPSIPSSSDLITPSTKIAYPDTSGKESFIARNAAATEYLTGMQKTIDDIRAQREAEQAKAVAAQDVVVSGWKDKLKGFVSGTAATDKLNELESTYKLAEKEKSLTDIQRQIADEQSAMTQGMIYEESRPVRATLLQGRSYEVQKQGLARIASYQATAEILKGSLDRATDYVSRAIGIYKDDINNQKEALNTLIELENSKLTTLTDDEKQTVKDRMAALDSQATQLETNKTTLLEIAQKFPQSFQKSGATFTDTPEEVIAKMLPLLSERERLELEGLRADIAAKNRSNRGTGSGSTGSVLADFDASMQELINAAFQEGISLDQFIADAGGPSKFTKKQLDALQDFWSTFKKEPTDKVLSASDLEKMGDDYDPTKHPEYVNKTQAEIEKLKSQAPDTRTPSQKEKDAGVSFWKPWTWNNPL